MTVYQTDTTLVYPLTPYSFIHPPKRSVYTLSLGSGFGSVSQVISSVLGSTLSSKDSKIEN